MTDNNERMIKEINSRKKDELGCVIISELEYMIMKKIGYVRPENINMYIVNKDILNED